MSSDRELLARMAATIYAGGFGSPQDTAIAAVAVLAAVDRQLEPLPSPPSPADTLVPGPVSRLLPLKVFSRYTPETIAATHAQYVAGRTPGMGVELNLEGRMFNEAALVQGFFTDDPEGLSSFLAYQYEVPPNPQGDPTDWTLLEQYGFWRRGFDT